MCSLKCPSPLTMSIPLCIHLPLICDVWYLLLLDCLIHCFFRFVRNVKFYCPISQKKRNRNNRLTILCLNVLVLSQRLWKTDKIAMDECFKT